MPLTRTPLLSETVRKLLARGAYVNAFNILNRLHPADVAGILADLPDHPRREAFKTLHKRNLTLAGAALSELGPERGGSILSDMSSQEISELLQELDPDDAAAFLSSLAPEIQEAILGVAGEGSVRGRGSASVSRGDLGADHEPQGVLPQR